MKRNSQIVNERYEALMFAKDRDSARRAARELVRAVLGDEALQRPLEQAMRECCRRFRPSQDAREQARFESEFLELVFAPSGNQAIAAA